MTKAGKLECVFCSECGERIGWAESLEAITVLLYCDDCKKEIDG